MNDKLLQEVAHLLRKYYDDRGAKLENYAEKIIQLVNENAPASFFKKPILTISNSEVECAALLAEKDLPIMWKQYKTYVADAIESAVKINKGAISLYEE